MKKLKIHSIHEIPNGETVMGRVVCKYCRSARTRKYGLVEGIQRYFCNDCRRKFSPSDRLFKMKTPAIQVAAALEMYYLGLSIYQVRDQLGNRYGINPSSKTIYTWIIKYTESAIKQFKDYYLEVGGHWAVMEAEIQQNAVKYICRDVFDIETGYCLSVKVYTTNEKYDPRSLLAPARERSGKNPLSIAVPGERQFSEAIKTVFGPGASQISVGPYKTSDRRWIEGRLDALQCRNRTLGRFKDRRMAEKFAEGFRAYYNYLRQNEAGDGITPAEKANVHYTVKSWLDVTLMADSDIQVLDEPAKG